MKFAHEKLRLVPIGEKAFVYRGENLIASTTRQGVFSEEDRQRYGLTDEI
jgi:hypothetical protein